MRTLLTAALAALLAVSWGTANADDSGYSVKASGDEPVIYFTRLHHRVRDVDDHQSLSVFANGTVRVHTPSYMINPGTFEYTLSQKAMQSLLRKLDSRGLMGFDVASAQAQKAAVAEARRVSENERFHVSDLTATHIRLNFASFGSATSGARSVRSDIVWNDLPADALRYRNIQAIQQLADAERILLALTDHSSRDATRLAGGR